LECAALVSCLSRAVRELKQQIELFATARATARPPPSMLFWISP
jgi:hypothetical protein